MSQYNIFQAIYMSFYSKALYRDVVKNWGGKTFLYLLLIVALSWIAFTFLIQSSINRAYQEKSDAYTNQVPVLTIKNGKIITPENRPYIIVDPQTHERIAIIDTSGHYMDIDQAGVPFLVTDHKIISKSSEREIKTYELSPTLTMTINPHYVNDYVKGAIKYAWILLYVFFVFFSYIYRLIQALIYGLIGKIVANIGKVPLTFSQVMQIAMVAVTPALVIACIIDSLEIFFRFQMLFYFLLSMFYLFYGIFANKS